MKTTEDYLIYLYPDYKRILKETPNANSLAKIKIQISKITSVTPGRFDEKNRYRSHVNSRQLLATILKIFTPLSLSEIGIEIGGKDHATVMHSIKKVASLHETDRKYRNDFNDLIKATENIMLRNYKDKPPKHYKGLSREVWKQAYQELLTTITEQQAIQPRPIGLRRDIQQLEEIIKDKDREIRLIRGQLERSRIKNEYSYVD